MLNLADLVVRRVLDLNWVQPPALPQKPGFYFTVPDDDWRAKVKESPNVRLNLYLYEMRENRDFRRAEWDEVRLADNSIVMSAPPAYFDCHYLISAWSPAEDSEALAPILDEHQVLGEALRVLLANADVRPVDIGLPAGGPVFSQARVYLSIAPPESARVVNDFWTSMKVPWRASVPLIVTAPVDLLVDSAPALPVVTLVQRYGSFEPGGNFEERTVFGGLVLNDATGDPIAGASVLLVASQEAQETDPQGRFAFVGTAPGVVRLRVEASGFAPIERDVDLVAGGIADHIFRMT